MREGWLWGSCLAPGPPEPHTPAAASFTRKCGSAPQPRHGEEAGQPLPTGQPWGVGLEVQTVGQGSHRAQSWAAPQASLNWEPALTDDGGAPSFQLVLAPSSRPGRSRVTPGPERHQERALERWWRESLEAPSSGPSWGSLDDKPPRTWRGTEEDPQAGVLIQGQIRGLRNTRWLVGDAGQAGSKGLL